MVSSTTSIIFMPIVYFLGRRMGKIRKLGGDNSPYSLAQLFASMLGTVAANPVGEYFYMAPRYTGSGFTLIV